MNTEITPPRPKIKTLEPVVVHFTEHPSKSGISGPLFKIAYSSLLRTVSEYYAPGAKQDWLRNRFSTFWIAAGGHAPAPPTTEAAIARARAELKIPTQIEFVDQKYPEIISRKY